jgi:hypothetical protein
MLPFYWGCAYEEVAAVNFTADNGSSSLPQLPPSLLVISRPPSPWRYMLDLTLSSCVQVGLVVGKLRASSDHTLVYSLLPTPPTNAGEPACSLQAAAP